MLLSVDPGVKLVGVAAFEDRELVGAWMSRGSDWRDTVFAFKADLQARYPSDVLVGVTLAIEKPQVYHQSKLKGDPADLIELALVVGGIAVCMHWHEVIEYLPRQWKGSVPKGVMTARIKSKLSPEEHERVELPSAKGLQHNVWDAVGIGRYHQRRHGGNQNPA